MTQHPYARSKKMPSYQFSAKLWIVIFKLNRLDLHCFAVTTEWLKSKERINECINYRISIPLSDVFFSDRSCLVRSGNGAGNYSSSRGVRTWLYSSPSNHCDFCCLSLLALHGVHRPCCHGLVTLVSVHIRCPCVYCLCHVQHVEYRFQPKR